VEVERVGLIARSELDASRIGTDRLVAIVETAVERRLRLVDAAAADRVAVVAGFGVVVWTTPSPHDVQSSRHVG
jgi:hypothetical protein